MIQTVLSEINKVWEALPGFLEGLLTACIIFAIGVLIIKLGRRIISKGFLRYSTRHPESNRGGTLQTLLTSLFNILMYTAVGLTCLSALGVNVTSLLAVAGVSGVAIGFGCQTLVKDIISGMFLWFEGSCKVGDIVTLSGQTGKVENVSLRTTTLRGTNGNIYVIPNGEIRTVVNMTSDFRCAVVDVTIAHGQDYTNALKVLAEAMQRVNEKFDFIDEDPVVRGYVSMDRGAATIRIECRCPVDKCWELERGIRLTALEALKEANIKP